VQKGFLCGKVTAWLDSGLLVHPDRSIRQPRVVHLTPTLFGQGGIFGGAERYTYELARHMARVTPTTLVSFSDRSQRYSTPEGLRVRMLGKPWYVRGQRINPGQVFASDLGGGGWGFSSYIDTNGWFHGHLHISRYSQVMAGHESRFRAEVIYGGVDTDLFSPDDSVRKEPMIVYVGRLMPHKGVNDLIEALPEGMTLELIGRPYHDRFQAELKRLSSGKQVIFRHDCDDLEIVRAYRRATCVVLPSVYRDCFGNETKVPELLGQTLLEGMACGIPAICTAVASMPEVVTDGETGFVVPPNNPAALRTKLEYLKSHPEEAAKMGRAARNRVLNHFNWPMVVRRCLAAYREGAGEAAWRVT
jgi:glycosyltransferase involved in cell wall biosynthesis